MLEALPSNDRPGVYCELHPIAVTLIDVVYRVMLMLMLMSLTTRVFIDADRGVVHMQCQFYTLGPTSVPSDLASLSTKVSGYPAQLGPRKTYPTSQEKLF